MVSGTYASCFSVVRTARSLSANYGSQAGSGLSREAQAFAAPKITRLAKSAGRDARRAPAVKNAAHEFDFRRRYVLTKNMAIGSARMSLASYSPSVAADHRPRRAIINNCKFKSRELHESSRRAMRF